ncbi:ImmA/IrrE family metallo-endopeptidase [Propioniciclava sp. MC1595]|uniref:ImmA/IrrE family metallo-endopeptidase n=1 Tax=unclassified Propioniciclava TaxID=2642922 RepID=UPI0016007BAF|nr:MULTISPECIES: ImmA/IrrE family metallo-endopeptidase [unclassified Propioniciclava]MBB1494112.1 ImmA/IrrE family metallo-endopeptidase [Propioniciclava sp. MC1595]MBB1502939.1 ImmA/IrrE family metallo-endopeptidase [Propioniciclava sp. MC1683]QTE25478.1 ImmA/IrrE family metallo-endopeptidase [Propioniciclava sp. MC1595]
MYHPWRHFRSFAHWDLAWAHLPVSIVGLTDFGHERVTLDPRQTHAERRSTIAHEVAHIERGPAPRGWWWQQREEAVVDQLAARRLIGIRDLGEALAWSTDAHEVADELWVDVPTLEARLRHLHPSDRHYLRRRLAHQGDEAHAHS